MAERCSSRLDRIKTWLTEHEAEIQAMGAGSIHVDFAGEEITLKVVRVERLKVDRGVATLVTMD